MRYFTALILWAVMVAPGLVWAQAAPTKYNEAVITWTPPVEQNLTMIMVFSSWFLTQPAAPVHTVAATGKYIYSYPDAALTDRTTADRFFCVDAWNLRADGQTSAVVKACNQAAIPPEPAPTPTPVPEPLGLKLTLLSTEEIDIAYNCGPAAITVQLSPTEVLVKCNP